MQMKRYLEQLWHRCSDEAFGQDAVEWGVLSGHVRLTYDLDTDLRTIMGDACHPSQPRACPDCHRPTRLSTDADVPMIHCTGKCGWWKPVMLGEYGRLCEAYRAECRKHEAVLVSVYEQTGFLDEVQRPVPLSAA